MSYQKYIFKNQNKKLPLKHKQNENSDALKKVQNSFYSYFTSKHFSN
jgi:hypothetical protein